MSSGTWDSYPRHVLGNKLQVVITAFSLWIIHVLPMFQLSVWYAELMIHLCLIFHAYLPWSVWRAGISQTCSCGLLQSTMMCRKCSHTSDKVITLLNNLDGDLVSDTEFDTLWGSSDSSEKAEAKTGGNSESDTTKDRTTLHSSSRSSHSHKQTAAMQHANALVNEQWSSPVCTYISVL